MFDEFQDIVKVREMDAILRGHIQHQGEVASYVFSGSEATLMRRLFEERERPLYGQAVPMKLGRLADADIAAYVAERFRGTDREVGDALGPLLEVARGHPQRAMLLAHRLWAEVEAGRAATAGDWSRALDAALDEVGPELEARWARFSPAEQKTLRALVAGRGSPYRTAVLGRLDLPKASAQQALKTLRARSDVEAADGGYAIVDPLLALWIERLAGGHTSD